MGKKTSSVKQKKQPNRTRKVTGWAYRPEVIDMVEKIHDRTGADRGEIVEYCVAREAARFEDLVVQAVKAISRIVLSDLEHLPPNVVLAEEIRKYQEGVAKATAEGTLEDPDKIAAELTEAAERAARKLSERKPGATSQE